MASLALHLRSHRLKPSQTLLSLSHRFSSSSSSNNNDNNNGDKPYPFSSYFSDIKSKLQQHQQSPGFRQQQHSNNNSPNVASYDDIRKNLSDFRRRSSVPPPDIANQQLKSNTTPFQNLAGNAGNPNPNLNREGKAGNLSFDRIRESLRLMKGRAAESNTSDKMSLNNYRQSFKMKPPMSGGGDGGVGGMSMVIGGSVENLPTAVFGKEMREKEMKKGGGSGVSEDDLELFRMYTHDELGKKLRELRPEVKKGKEEEKAESWFSLSELGERLKKLKVIEEKQVNSTVEGRAFSDLRKKLSSIRENDEEKKKSKNVSLQSFGLFTPPSFMKSPPKEHLVEKYFHPDNMSAEEKLKLELKKMRDEFKMHESDCGSTRVQIAQLTTEILHLSSVLHKKDKHSRRGLQAKVQQRKKLLKYLRRTDWESYCFVLSKLGLRDNPDYKN